MKPNPRTTTSAQRAIEEADIIQVDGGLLYAMSKSGTVSIVDISTPGRLALLGQTTLAGEPFEMYRRGDFLIAMSNDAVGTDGRVTVTRTGVDGGGGALVSVLDVRDPTQLVEVATLKVPGEIADSRVVGNVLYVAAIRAMTLPLPLLVLLVRADHPHHAAATDDLALVANPLDRRSDLHSPGPSIPGPAPPAPGPAP